MATIQGLTPDANGQVNIFDVPDGKWKKVAYVDAREMLAKGTASLGDDLVELTGPAGNITVHKSQVRDHEARGYKLIADKVDGSGDPKGRGGNPTPNPNDKKGDGKGEGDSYNFMKHTVPELKEFAKQAGLKDFDGMSKAQLAAALDDSGWIPQD